MAYKMIDPDDLPSAPNLENAPVVYFDGCEATIRQPNNGIIKTSLYAVVPTESKGGEREAAHQKVVVARLVATQETMVGLALTLLQVTPPELVEQYTKILEAREKQ